MHVLRHTHKPPRKHTYTQSKSEVDSILTSVFSSRTLTEGEKFKKTAGKKERDFSSGKQKTKGDKRRRDGRMGQIKRKDMKKKRKRVVNVVIYVERN